MDTVFDVVDVVLGFLALLSVLTWTVAIVKFVRFRQDARESEAFLRAFRAASGTRDLSRILPASRGTLAAICSAGLQELDSIRRSSVVLDAMDRREILQHALRQQMHAEQTRLESGLAVLASVGSTAPFIGLFGTVWGIMHALTNISQAGSASLDVVAGPIGEALIATAIGIAAAVPAVLAYNFFLRKVRLAVIRMESFASAFQHLVIKSQYEPDSGGE
jgi:biopolymer transport protein ExbB